MMSIALTWQRCTKADGATVVLRAEFGKRAATDSQEYLVRVSLVCELPVLYVRFFDFLFPCSSRAGGPERDHGEQLQRGL
jgi:hypothetical protein